MARPSVFAVFKLITNSTLVDCSTGSSAGEAPSDRHKRRPAAQSGSFAIERVKTQGSYMSASPPIGPSAIKT